MNLSNALTFIAPPIVGAGIGLFTNWLAIKMLFRPLAEKRILGLRLPFTPGILPRERERISLSLADTVAVDLLDEETVISRLKSPAVRDAIRDAISQSARKALDSRPSKISSAMDSGMVEVARRAAVEALTGLTVSETFSGAVDAGAAAALGAARGMPLASVVDPAIIDGVSRALSSPNGSRRAGESIADAMLSLLERAAAEGKSLSSFIGKDALRAFASRALDTAYPAMIEAVRGFLAQKAVIASMEKAGARIIRRTLDRFNSFQRFFIGLGQYDKAIMENMPATIADFSESAGLLLSEASTKAALSERVSAAVAGFAEKPLSSLPFLSDTAARLKARDSLAEALSGALASADAESIAGIASGMLGRGTVGDVLDAFPGLSSSIGPTIARWAAGLLSGEPGKDSSGGMIASAFFSAFSASFKERASDVPLKRTIAVDEALIDELALAAAEGLTRLAAAESATMLRSIDIRSLVVEKIDSLDMIDVERMILKVVDKELGAITAFGGILGAIIGIFQSLLFLLR